MPALPIRLADAQFRPGDLIVHWAYWPDGRAINRISDAIAEFGRGKACHLGMLDMEPRGEVLVPRVVEMVPPEGRVVDLAPRITEYPGTIHWLRVPHVVALDYTASGSPVCHFYDRQVAVTKMREYIGVPYGFDTIRRDYWHGSWARWFADLPEEDEVLDWLPVCSTAALDALQVGFGGWDLLRNLHTMCAHPEDVNRIAFLEDQGALLP